MKRWTLKQKVGIYSAALTMLSLLVTAVIILLSFHLHLRNETDVELAEDVDELVGALRNFRGAPVDPRRPLQARFIPASLRERLLVVRGPEGQLLYATPGLDPSVLQKNGRKTFFLSIEGEQYRVGRFPREPYEVTLAACMAEARVEEQRLITGFLVAVPIIGLLAFVGGHLLGKRAVAPVADLSKASERISTSHPGERLPVPESRDEIARLSVVLNETFDRLQSSFESVRRFSADASHQLKTPIALLRLDLDELQGRLDDPEQQAQVEGMLSQVRRLATLVEDLLLLAQMDAGRLEMERAEVAMGELVEGAVEDLDILLEGREVTLSSSLEELSVQGDRRRLSLILQNLTENAAKYVDDGGRVEVSLKEQEGRVVLVIGNSGPGIPEGDRERVFERFHRGSKVGENVRGHGLGLNIARELARAQGGELRVGSREGWTEFELELEAA